MSVQADFSIALIQLKKGKKMARTGWNGKNMHVVLTDRLDPTVGQYFVMHKRDPGAEFHQPGWVPSIGDVLANDWVEVA